jgi:hypothetical protein
MRSMIHKAVVAGSIVLCAVGLAAQVARASDEQQILRRSATWPSEGQAVTIQYDQSQNPGCPSATPAYLYLGINGVWSVVPMSLVSISCAPSSSGGGQLWSYTVAPQPAGTVVEYVVNIPSRSQWLKAGSNLAYNEWHKASSSYGSYQNFQYVTDSFFDAVYHWPPNGQITSQTDLWINTETSPAGVANYVRVVYSTDGVNWQSADMELAEPVNGNDWWHVNLGKFPAGATVRYAVEAIGDSGVSRWDNNNWNDYRATVNAAQPVYWIGNVYNWPFNGQIKSADDFWVNIESWPRGAATYARVVYSTDGGATWNSRDLELGGQVGNNDWWHVNLGKFPSGTTIRYAIEVRDATGKSIWANNNRADYRATVN